MISNSFGLIFANVKPLDFKLLRSLFFSSIECHHYFELKVLEKINLVFNKKCIFTFESKG